MMKIKKTIMEIEQIAEISPLESLDFDWKNDEATQISDGQEEIAQVFKRIRREWNSLKNICSVPDLFCPVVK